MKRKLLWAGVVLRGDGALEKYDASKDDSLTWKPVGFLGAEQ